MSSPRHHRRLAGGRAVALALLLVAAGCSAPAAETLDPAQRTQATNDLTLLIDTARSAWAYAEDKAEHFDVSLDRLQREGNAAIGRLGAAAQNATCSWRSRKSWPG